MTKTKAFAALFLLAAAPAAATPLHEVCAPDASGVPTREGPPKWLDWPGSGVIPADQSLDDPRWLGSVGQSFEFGSAQPPLQSRAVVKHVGASDYLFLSFIVNLDPSPSTPRDLFLGFRRVTPIAGAGGTEFGYIFQYHLTGTAAAHPTVAPLHCGRFSECAEGGSSVKDYWRVFVDHNGRFKHNNPDDCPNGHLFDRLVGSSPDVAPFTWMVKPTTTACTTDATCTPLNPNSYCNLDGFCTSNEDAVRYWKLGASQPPLLQNQWAVQVRIPIVAAGQPISMGIERDATFYYQVTEKTSGNNYANVAWWPKELTTSICTSPTSGVNDFLVHPELGSVDTNCPTPVAPEECLCPSCSPDHYSGLAELTPGTPRPTPPPGCDGGIAINHQDVGSLFSVPVGSDITYFTTHNPNNEFKSGGVNTIVAQIENTSSAPISAAIQGRFRLAGWGSEPWSDPSDTGTWKDLRPTKNGVCTGGTPPPCGSMTIAPGGKGAIWVNWTIGDDTGTGGMGNSEFCKYGLPLPSGSCVDGCSCTAAGALCDETSGTGTQAPGGPCVSKIYQFDQCMLVDLSANSAVSFESQSTWNNMTFGTMSVLAREALIDARKLPTAPGQQFQDIYLLVMPRNMPAAVPGNSTGISLIQERAIEMALKISQPYIDDLARIPRAQLQDIADKIERPASNESTGGSDDKRIGQIERALRVMSKPDFERVSKLLSVALDQGNAQKSGDAVVHDAVAALGPSAAANVVPTLEIYPYYQPLGQGKAYQPMTSFSVFLSHEGGLGGIHYQIDGADLVSENIYHLRIPVGNARKIQIRAQALVGGEAVLAPGMPKWPCAGCACGGVGAQRCGLVTMVGNTAPGLIAGVLVIRRRRKQPSKAAKSAS